MLKVLQENTTAASPGTTRSSPFQFDQYYEDDNDDGDDDGDDEYHDVDDDGGEGDGDNDCPDQDKGGAHHLEPLTPDKVEPKVTFSVVWIFQQISFRIFELIFVETFQ